MNEIMKELFPVIIGQFQKSDIMTLSDLRNPSSGRFCNGGDNRGFFTQYFFYERSKYR